MMNGELVSLIIPVYNSAPYLPMCLESLLEQTYKNIEIICVNDGSTDDSLNVLEMYERKDSRVRVFTKDNEGKGAAPARNKGMSYARGTYVLVLDSDDFFQEDMVERMVNKADETKAEIVFCTARHYDHLNQCSGSIFKRPELQYTPEKEPFSWRDCPDYIFQIADFVAWNKLFRRDFYEKHHLEFEGIPISDDQYPSVMGSVLAERIAVIKEPFVNYRINTGESQTDSRHKHPEAAYQACYSVVNRMRELGVYDAVKRSYCNIAILLLRQYFDRMRTIENVRFLYEKIRKEVLPFLGAEHLNKDYFYDHRIWEWYDLIMHHDLDDIMFLTARAYRADLTTAALRFQVPFGEIHPGSNVAVIGKDIAGKYWYTELILSERCNEVYWFASEEDIPENVTIDNVLYAK